MSDEQVIRQAVHQSDSATFEPDEQGFYVARCTCGWTFGPVPDIETMVDCLMAHAETEGA